MSIRADQHILAEKYRVIERNNPSKYLLQFQNIQKIYKKKS